MTSADLLDGILDALVERLAAKLAVPAAPLGPRKPLLSKQDLAVQLGVSVATIDRLCREELIPWLVVGDSKRFDLEEVRAALPRGPSVAKAKEALPPNTETTVRYATRRGSR